jgi:tetratricopeptide (TPR) repeat protein
VLLGLLLILLCIAAGRWFSQNRTAPLPKLPDLALEGVDPEVAATIAEARAAVDKSPRSLEAWARLAMLLDAHLFFDEAATSYAAAEALDSINACWPYLQGTIYKNGPNPEKALPCFQRAVDLAAGQPMPALQLGDLLLALGRVEDAAREYQRVLVNDPKGLYEPYARFGLARVAIARQEYLQSLSYLQAAADDPHVRKRACALRATVHERLGNHQDADKERRRFAELPEDVPWPDVFHQVNRMRVGLRGRIDQANYLVRQNNPAQAVKLMEETVQKYPQSDQAWLALGVAMENVKNPAGAEKAMETAIRLAPGRADHRFYLGELLQSQQRFKEAAAAFRKASELRPVDSNTYLRLGECLLSQGDKTGAVEAFHKAVRYNPDLKEARQHLEKLGNKGT